MFDRVLNTYTKFPTFPAFWKTLYSVWLFPVDQKKKTMRFNPLIMTGGNNSSYVLKPATKSCRFV